MKAKFGVFSLSASSPDGNDARYLEWHHLDHLPQQYEIEGMLYGQRWVSTPECRAMRTAQSDRFQPVNHVVHYLLGEPVAKAVDDFFALRDHLIEVGRFPERLPNRLVAGCEPVEVHAAASAYVTADIVPYRPNRGVYLVIERADPPHDRVSDTARWSPADVDALLAIDGVAGLWTFAPSTLRPDEFSQSGYTIAACYLDGDVVGTARPIGEVLSARWRRESVEPALAAPFVSLQAFDYERHRQPG
jgi:hypothetical protein